MPTTIYSHKKNIGSLNFEGKAYSVSNGAADVPDHAVDILCESHGFSREKPADDKAGKEESEDVFDLTKLTKNGLIQFNIDSDLGAEIKQSMTKDEIFAILKPLWDATLKAQKAE